MKSTGKAVADYHFRLFMVAALKWAQTRAIIQLLHFQSYFFNLGSMGDIHRLWLILGKECLNSKVHLKSPNNIFLLT